MRDGDESVFAGGNPQHDVGEGEVGEQLEVADEHVQPIDVGLAAAPWARTRSLRVDTDQAYRPDGRAHAAATRRRNRPIATRWDRAGAGRSRSST
ncbi:hypothetical protein GCM10025870_07600 [Agromyces marinus]|uniref:Uncharacterized protein n=1 Tax=Agromyces marinus TaxID=1389020 RepID=A0ABM8GYZ2_9MICO|nr:hypothetical protein GCM10025870_07600 [Agromyces marinus]